MKTIKIPPTKLLILMFLVLACSCTVNVKKNDEDTKTVQQAHSTSTLRIPGKGDEYADLEMQSTDGVTMKLSDYVGHNRCVLVDCWASWCGPCLGEMPRLVKFYKKNHKNGLEIVGISFDKNMGQWLDAIHGFGMTWPQMSDLKGWGSVAGKIYGIKSLPHTMLLDERGKIIAVDLRGDALFAQINHLLNQPVQ